MTIHAYVDHSCQSCGNLFVPLPNFESCPKCGHRSQIVFEDFIQQTLESASYNLTQYGALVPPAWGTFTIGDHYYWLAFHFLSYLARSLHVAERGVLSQAISESQARKLAKSFIKRLDFGNQKYMSIALQNYLSGLAISLGAERAKEKPARLPEVFLSHSSADKTFCDKLYADLLASGISCWYFPEDAIPGKKVWDEIDPRIRSCRKVIVVCSKESLLSPPVLREIERALQREDAEGSDILLPIKIDDYLFQQWEHPRKADVIQKVVGDFTKWKSRSHYTESLQRLCGAIKC